MTQPEKEKAARAGAEKVLDTLIAIQNSRSLFPPRIEIESAGVEGGMFYNIYTARFGLADGSWMAFSYGERRNPLTPVPGPDPTEAA